MKNPQGCYAAFALSRAFGAGVLFESPQRVAILQQLFIELHITLTFLLYWYRVTLSKAKKCCWEDGWVIRSKAFRSYHKTSS